MILINVRDDHVVHMVYRFFQEKCRECRYIMLPARGGASNWIPPRIRASAFFRHRLCRLHVLECIRRVILDDLCHGKAQAHSSTPVAAFRAVGERRPVHSAALHFRNKDPSITNV